MRPWMFLRGAKMFRKRGVRVGQLTDRNGRVTALPRLPYETCLLCHLGSRPPELAGDFYTRQLVSYVFYTVL
jgi:hypothetical protein